MLHCGDRTFYVGHTDDLDARLAQHDQGTFGGYTARKLPVQLVWCEEFPTRYEALAAERRVKGWRREKKLALIRGDWNEISRLASQKKRRPSTGSGRTGYEATVNQGGFGQTQPLDAAVRPEPAKGRHFHLFAHPSSPCRSVAEIQAFVSRKGDFLDLHYQGCGDIAALVLPPRSPPMRKDRLWEHTCFEAFLGFPDGPYWELNFSTSSEWAAYSFLGRRSGMDRLAVSPPRIAVRQDGATLELDVRVELAGIPDRSRLGLSAIIEERSGRKSYWALAHPPGDPDFHHPACFAAELPAPARP